MDYSYDSKSLELAEHFISDEQFETIQDTREAAEDLAREIQKAVESWFEYSLPNFKPDSPCGQQLAHLDDDSRTLYFGKLGTTSDP